MVGTVTRAWARVRHLGFSSAVAIYLTLGRLLNSSEFHFLYLMKMKIVYIYMVVFRGRLSELARGSIPLSSRHGIEAQSMIVSFPAIGLSYVCVSVFAFALLIIVLFACQGQNIVAVNSLIKGRWERKGRRNNSQCQAWVKYPVGYH